jgi:hypothetical protein
MSSPSIESPRLPFFDGSTHKASPAANWFNRAHQIGRGEATIGRVKRDLGPGRVAPGDRRDGASAHPVRETSAAAQRRGWRWICATAGVREPPDGRSASFTDRRNWYTTSRPFVSTRNSPSIPPGTRDRRLVAPWRISSNSLSPACAPSRSDPRCAGPLFRATARYIRSIIALPNPEQLTCVEPGIRRAKS